MKFILPAQSADPPAGYSGLSIALHWLGALIVIALVILGSLIATAGPNYREALERHTSVAVAVYLILWLRVLWRFRLGHPMPHPTQRGWAFSIGKAAHYVLLVVLVSMLITGPMSVWFNGEPIRVFGVHIVSPFAARLSVADFAHRAHVFGANIIIVVTLLHIGGVIKHTAINGDRTLDRMLIPGNRLRDSE